MNKDHNEEYGIEIRNRRCKAYDGTPSETHDPVGNIVLRNHEDTLSRWRKYIYWFPGVSPESTGEETVSEE